MVNSLPQKEQTKSVTFLSCEKSSVHLISDIVPHIVNSYKFGPQGELHVSKFRIYLYNWDTYMVSPFYGLRQNDFSLVQNFEFISTKIVKFG